MDNLSVFDEIFEQTPLKIKLIKPDEVQHYTALLAYTSTAQSHSSYFHESKPDSIAAILFCDEPNSDKLFDGIIDQDNIKENPVGFNVVLNTIIC